MEFAFGRSLKAQILHQNALSISVIMRDLERELAKAVPELDKLKQLASQYEQLNLETQVNHTAQDYKRWQYSVASSKEWWMMPILFVRYNIYRVWIFISSMFIYIGLCILIVVATTWCAFGL
ncbi:hypothetical protein ATC00_22485 [Sinorhizobium americanum]|nr:hypothetical protein ATC00_22485 [Sinorhizobium americanum]